MIRRAAGAAGDCFWSDIDLVNCVRCRGRPKAVFVFGTEDRRLMKPSVPKITEDCRRPKTEGYNRRSLTFKSGIT